MNTANEWLTENETKTLKAMGEYEILPFLHGWGITNDQGEKLDFYDHPYLKQLYADMSPRQAWLKAAQIGASTTINIKALWLAKYMKMDIIYTLPSSADIKDFVSGKTNRLIAFNKPFQDWTEDKDSIEQKKVGENVIYFKGCVSEDTEVLTGTGWKKHNELRIGESLPSVNLATMEVEDDEVLNISKFPSEGKAISIRNDSVDALVTDDHRCVVHYRGKSFFEIVRAFDLKPNSRQTMPLRTKGISKDNERYSDSFVKVLGWVITEGCFWTLQQGSSYIRKDGSKNTTKYLSERVSIIQKKKGGVLAIRDALAGAGLEFYEIKRKDGCIVFRLSAKSSRRIRLAIPTKQLTFSLVNQLTRIQIELMLGVLIEGDGHITKSGFRTFIQKDTTTIDAFQYLTTLIGLGSTVRFRTKKNSYSTNEIGEVSIKTHKSLTKYDFCTVPYTGIMWCPTTKNGTIFTRRKGHVWLTGQTWTERAALATPADLYISDETDRSKQENVAQYKTRLQHSKYGWEWYFSNPSAPGVGVDKQWQLSDQKHWFVRCACNTGEQHGWQFITMKNIMYNDASKPYFGCMECKKELNRYKGQWVRKYNDRDISGYWIPLFVSPRISAEYILNKKKELSEEQFTNFVLGQPYVGRGNVLTKVMFLQNLTSYVNPQSTRPIIGVDTGIGINYVVGNMHGLFFYDKCEDYTPLENLMRRWPNAIMVIDQGGDIIGPRKLREKFPNRVFLCFFRPDRKNDELITWRDEDGSVQADRNKMIQTVIGEFNERRIPIAGTEADWYDYWLEWSGMYRTVEENALGVPVYKWNKPSSGRCDYPFATVYWRIGMERFMEQQSNFFEPGGEFYHVGLDANPDGTTSLPRPIFLPRPIG